MHRSVVGLLKCSENENNEGIGTNSTISDGETPDFGTLTSTCYVEGYYNGLVGFR